MLKVTRAWTPEPKKVARTKIPIWDRGIEDILKNLQTSIDEATGRYHTEGGAYDKPKASKCWTVLAKMVNPQKPKGLENELCSIGIKATTRKLKILEVKDLETDKPIKVDSTEIAGMALRDQLMDFKLAIEKVRRNSVFGEALYEELKLSYQPPNARDKYEFDEEAQIWKLNAVEQAKKDAAAKKKKKK